MINQQSTDYTQLPREERNRGHRKRLKKQHIYNDDLIIMTSTECFKYNTLDQQFLANLKWCMLMKTLKSNEFKTSWNVCDQNKDHINDTYEYLHAMI